MRGGRASAGLGRGRYSTQQLIQPEMISIRDLDFESPKQSDFSTCTNKAVSVCATKFGTSQRGFSDCLYGFLVTNALLPPAIMALASEATIDTTGAFAVGATQSCQLIPPGNNYPGMVAYY